MLQNSPHTLDTASEQQRPADDTRELSPLHTVRDGSSVSSLADVSECKCKIARKSPLVQQPAVHFVSDDGTNRESSFFFAFQTSLIVCVRPDL